MWNRFVRFLRSCRGTAAIEFAICFPLFIIIFYQYIGIYQNIRLLSSLERATACLGDVLVNAGPTTIITTEEFMNTVMNSEPHISDKAIQDAFLSMVGKSSVKGTIRVTYHATSETEDVALRVIPVNGGAAHYDGSKESLLDSLLKTTARNATDDPADQYKNDLLMVYACVDNPVQNYGVVTKLVFPEVFCSTFVAPRRK